MSFGAIFSIMAAIIALAGITVAVSHPETSQIISSVSNGFTGSLKAAMGNG